MTDQRHEVSTPPLAYTAYAQLMVRRQKERKGITETILLPLRVE